MRIANGKREWEVGDRVEWNGSSDPYSRRMYRGIIIDTSPGYAVVIDDEWGARNGVAFFKLRLASRED